MMNFEAWKLSAQMSNGVIPSWNILWWFASHLTRTKMSIIIEHISTYHDSIKKYFFKFGAFTQKIISNVIITLWFLYWLHNYSTTQLHNQYKEHS